MLIEKINGLVNVGKLKKKESNKGKEMKLDDITLCHCLKMMTFFQVFPLLEDLYYRGYIAV